MNCTGPFDPTWPFLATLLRSWLPISNKKSLKIAPHSFTGRQTGRKRRYLWQKLGPVAPRSTSGQCLFSEGSGVVRRSPKTWRCGVVGKTDISPSSPEVNGGETIDGQRRLWNAATTAECLGSAPIYAEIFNFLEWERGEGASSFNVGNFVRGIFSDFNAVLRRQTIGGRLHCNP